jgi:large subunit ribosomal protein L3
MATKKLSHLGLIGKKEGMTRIFTAEGRSIPVTVVTIEANTVTQIKTTEKEGYTAVQLTTGKKRRSRVNKAIAGHYAKASVEAGTCLKEFQLTEDESKTLTVGQVFTVGDVFSEGQYVDVSGKSKGKGFAGTVKRYNYGTQPMSHGNSLSHRVLGSTGQNQSPGRVFKGIGMPGQMGNEKKIIQNLEIIRVDNERGLLLIKGAIPGAVNGRVVVTPAIKVQ